jgi:aconitate hydratase
VGDNITTDDIMPSDARLLPYRSNVPYLAKFSFEKIDKDFSKRCLEAKSCSIVGGHNYGQGSSREHAALVPLYLGVKFVVAKSFARIHRSNLINSGIIALTFENPDDYEDIVMGNDLYIESARAQVENGIVHIRNLDSGRTYTTATNFSALELEMILKGGKINL